MYIYGYFFKPSVAFVSLDKQLHIQVTCPKVLLACYAFSQNLIQTAALGAYATFPFSSGNILSL